MQVDRDCLPLIRLNAPGVFADVQFQEWLNSVALYGRPKDAGDRIATWHWPGKTPGCDSDLFIYIGKDECSDSDMPRHCLDAIRRALDAILEECHWECILWLSNISEVPGDDEDWELIRA